MPTIYQRKTTFHIALSTHESTGAISWDAFENTGAIGWDGSYGAKAKRRYH